MWYYLWVLGLVGLEPARLCEHTTEGYLTYTKKKKISHKTTDDKEDIPTVLKCSSLPSEKAGSYLHFGVVVEGAGVAREGENTEL